MTRIRDNLESGVGRERIKLEIRRATRPAAIYVAMIAFTLAVGIALLSHSNLKPPWDQPREYRVVLDNGAGVRPRLHDVRISGIRVGRINKMELVGGRAMLSVSIEREYGRLYHDAEVNLRPQSPLEDMYLDVVDRGTASAGDLGGDPLPASRTHSPVNMGTLLNTFDADTRARMGTLLDQLGTGLDDGGGEQLRAAFVEIAPFLTATARLTDVLRHRASTTRALVHDLRLLTDTLGTRDAQLTALVRDGSTTLQELAGNEREFEAVLGQLPPTFGQMRASFETLRGTLDAVDPALVALRPTAAALPRGLDALQAITAAANPALPPLRRAVSRLGPLAGTLPATAHALDRAFAQLRPQIPRLDRITAQFPPCELALQKFFHHTASLLKFDDAYGVIARGDAAEGPSVLGGLTEDPGVTVGPSCADSGPVR